MEVLIASVAMGPVKGNGKIFYPWYNAATADLITILLGLDVWGPEARCIRWGSDKSLPWQGEGDVMWFLPERSWRGSVTDYLLCVYVCVCECVSRVCVILRVVIVCVSVQDSSQQRLRSLQSLLTFIAQASEELAWLSEKEEIEISRDWSSQNLQLQELEDYFEVLPSCLSSLYVVLSI